MDNLNDKDSNEKQSQPSCLGDVSGSTVSERIICAAVWYKEIRKREEAKENIINDVQAIISKEKQIHFTIDELSEMEVLDAYHNQVKKYYPSKNQIPF